MTAGADDAKWLNCGYTIKAEATEFAEMYLALV